MTGLTTLKKLYNKIARDVSDVSFSLVPSMMSIPAIIENNETENRAVFENALFMWLWAAVRNITSFQKVSSLNRLDTSSLTQTQFNKLYSHIEQYRKTGKAAAIVGLANFLQLLLVLDGELEADGTNIIVSWIAIQLFFAVSLKFVKDGEKLLVEADSLSGKTGDQVSLLNRDVSLGPLLIPSPWASLAENSILLSLLPVLKLTAENNTPFIPVLLSIGFPVYNSLLAADAASRTTDKKGVSSRDRGALSIRETAHFLHSLTAFIYPVMLLMKLLQSGGELTETEEWGLLILCETAVMHSMFLRSYFEGYWNQGNSGTFFNNATQQQSPNPQSFETLEFGTQQQANQANQTDPIQVVTMNS